MSGSSPLIVGALRKKSGSRERTQAEKVMEARSAAVGGDTRLASAAHWRPARSSSRVESRRTSAIRARMSFSTADGCAAAPFRPERSAKDDPILVHSAEQLVVQVVSRPVAGADRVHPSKKPEGCRFGTELENQLLEAVLRLFGEGFRQTLAEP